MLLSAVVARLKPTVVVRSHCLRAPGSLPEAAMTRPRSTPAPVRSGLRLAVFFTSFVPKVRADNNIVCTEAIGYNYLYVLNVCDGRVNSQFLAQMGIPVVAQGLAGQLNQKGIAPEVAFLFPSPDNASGSGNKRPPPVCLVGAEACGQFSGYAPKRTFWQQKAAD